MEIPVLLDVKNLQTEFRSRSSVVRAVDDVSLQVDEGQTLALVGESGSGKSVTALSIMGLIKGPVARITGGEVIFEGRDVLQLRPKEVRALRGTGISMIFQDPMTSLNPSLTVGRQLTESLRLHRGMSRREARSRAVELLELVGISEPESRLRSYPHQFSGGMRQRVMIAIALACDPKLIVADEITTALDVTIQAQILELLRKLTRELGTAVVLITHDLGIVAGMSERVNVMYAGQIVEAADTAEVFVNPRMPYTWGLLSSIPRLDEPRATSLVPIQGSPPDMSDPPPGCRYQPRCPFARPICAERPPQLVPLEEKGEAPHSVRCWGMAPGPDGGWLRDLDWREAQRAAAEGGVAK